jgi:hypothetical protein
MRLFTVFFKGIHKFCFSLTVMSLLVSGCISAENTQTESKPALAGPVLEKPASAAKKVEAVRFDPVLKQIEGWTVSVDPEMLEGEHAVAGADALKMLANHLQRIAILLPAEQLKELRKLEIWIERHHPKMGNMQYHPGVRWLKSHGHDPRLVKKVHITRAKNLLSRSQMLKHPAVILHELAHSYHDQVLGFDDPRIVKAYEKAMEAKLYDKVMLYTGRRVRHYGATDCKEYFAEGTEAYFYRNDFYPFVAAELKEHDPLLYDLMVEIWGPLK